jgi:hypothetical protein
MNAKAYTGLSKKTQLFINISVHFCTNGISKQLDKSCTTTRCRLNSQSPSPSLQLIVHCVLIKVVQLQGVD